MNVPFVRVLKHSPPAEVGSDVKAIQRALHDANALQAGYISGRYGTATWAAVGRFQKRQGIRITRDYNLATHERLSPHFDAYGRWLMIEQLKAQKAGPRAALTHTAFWYYSQRYQIAYSQTRPIYTVYHGCKPPCIPPYLDCSGFFVSCYYADDLLSKLGAGHQGGSGNTWSLWAQGQQVTTGNAKPGDGVFYDGPEGELQHMAIVVGANRVISNGHHPMGLYPYDMSPGYLRIHGFRSYL